MLDCYIVCNLNSKYTEMTSRNKPTEKPKVIVILGPTATGKSELAVQLAQRYNGEIISADSRQVYKGLDIGSGKVPGKWRMVKGEKRARRRDRKYFIYKGILHHCIDYADPRRTYSVARFMRDGQKAIQEIIRLGHVPIICGGTGFYIDALLQDVSLPQVPPNKKLRATFEKQTTQDLFKKLKKLDPRRAATIDRFNRVRLVRALEIVLTTEQPVPTKKIGTFPYRVLKLGIKSPREKLKETIYKRVVARFKQGMIREVAGLHEQGINWKRFDTLGFEYRLVASYLQNKIEQAEMIEEFQREEWRYAKRQMTWFKKDKTIVWVEGTKQALAEVKKFLA